ncbi:MAG: glycosyltransferase family 2 protein [Candidatus Omnitrophica bacterium]|nr:glycosyltransferase family 2 protein [Candidatus Omnitrophota bacterium]MBI3021784.1 glycosyltransferase family 2 protein [Candidatus Omnitrophota bacterium]MBI3083490.1 glycosyltransferase family 2 protein [Candidatus Omnitrophota bacterium]
MTPALISIIIPARNEEGNIPRLEQEVLAVVEALPDEFEFIVVDNDSTDRTGELVKAICARDPRWKYLRLSRNFTVEMSMTAGLRAARGEAMIVLYSDLQDPPAVIPRFIAKWREGYDVVYGVRTARPGEPVWRNLAVHWVYRVIAWSSDVPIPPDAGDFRLISRQVRDALERCGEYNRYLRGLIAWLGFRQVGIPYERRARTAGRSQAPFWHLVFFAFNAITSFSLKPLRLFTFLGLALLLLSALALPVYVILAIVGSPPPGITTIITLLFVAIGLNSLGIGILGEYLGRTYAEVKRRPLYVIQETVNLPADATGPVALHPVLEER